MADAADGAPHVGPKLRCDLDEHAIALRNKTWAICGPKCRLTKLQVSSLAEVSGVSQFGEVGFTHDANSVIVKTPVASTMVGCRVFAETRRSSCCDMPYDSAVTIWRRDWLPSLLTCSRGRRTACR